MGDLIEWLMEWGPCLFLWLTTMGFLWRKTGAVEREVREVKERLDATLGPRKDNP